MKRRWTLKYEADGYGWRLVATRAPHGEHDESVEVCPVSELNERIEERDLADQLNDQWQKDYAELRRDYDRFRGFTREVAKYLRQLDHLLSCPGGMSPAEVQREGLRIVRDLTARLDPQERGDTVGL